jgi:hypothetical protein
MCVVVTHTQADVDVSYHMSTSGVVEAGITAVRPRGVSNHAHIQPVWRVKPRPYTHTVVGHHAQVLRLGGPRLGVACSLPSKWPLCHCANTHCALPLTLSLRARKVLQVEACKNHNHSTHCALPLHTNTTTHGTPTPAPPSSALFRLPSRCCRAAATPRRARRSGWWMWAPTSAGSRSSLPSWAAGGRAATHQDASQPDDKTIDAPRCINSFVIDSCWKGCWGADGPDA